MRGSKRRSQKLAAPASGIEHARNDALEARRLSGGVGTKRAGEMIAVLLHARSLLCECGWIGGRPRVTKDDSLSVRVEGDPLTLVDALIDLPPTPSRWAARVLLQRIARDPNLVDWNSNPYRTGADVVALVDRGICALGGTPPPTKYRDPRAPRRRGPRISNKAGGGLR